MSETTGAAREKVGFIGLGVMGAPMARNLMAAGYEVVAWNRSAGPLEELAAAGARAADGPGAVAGEADVVISIVKDDAAVREVLSGPEGAIGATPAGSLVIDMSTVSPALARELAEEAAAREVGFLDAPVSGGDVGARDGTLSIMVGGEAAEVERARPVFEVLGSRVTHVGAAGAGQVAKACNQVLVAVIFGGLAEALVLGSKLGVDPAAILDAVGGGMAANRIMEVRRDNFLDHDFAPGFKVDLHHKDLEIALGASGEVDAPLPLTAEVQQMFRQLRAAGFGEEDDSALLRVAEQRANHRLPD
ncbi:MAG: 2-hydroxy-3-oxopropionate reductase [Solirubrobacterales bacterium]|nr:2-hydroxy-3-oxopropionate reductase [Solirubrobacterales bacterium]